MAWVPPNVNPVPPLAKPVSSAASAAPLAPVAPLAPGATAPTYRRSLLGEILDWMLAPLFLLWPMSVAITYVVAQDIANTPYDRNLANALTVLTHQIEWSRNETPPTLTITPATRVALRTGDSEGIFWKAEVLGGPVISGDQALPSPEPPATISWLNAGDPGFRDLSLRGHDVRLAYTWVLNPTNPTAKPVLLVVAEGRESRVALANAIIKGVIIPQFLVLPIAALLIWFGLSRGVAPINALQRRLRARRPDDLSAIDEHATPSEITPLVTAMNDLLARLSGNVEAQRRFVADAAHQLKTPLAGLRTHAELALKSAPNQDIEESLRKIVNGTVQATRLINQLLLMATAENPDSLQRVPLDLKALAREVTEQWVPRALAAGIDLGFEAPESPAWIRGQALLLSEALNNLIDNALRYAPYEGHVTVSVKETAQTVSVSVQDNGLGIPEHERERVFDRFYRVLGTQSHGSGLGLAIVKEIAQRHQAQVTVTTPQLDQTPTGTCITLIFSRHQG